MEPIQSKSNTSYFVLHFKSCETADCIHFMIVEVEGLELVIEQGYPMSKCVLDI